MYAIKKEIEKYLYEAFIDWQANKLTKHFIYDVDIDRNLLDTLNLTKDEFIEKYLDIFNGRSVNELKKIFKIISAFLQKDSDSFFHVSIDLKVEAWMNALEWTEIYISYIFGFKPRHIPVGQCYVCGRTEDYQYIDNKKIMHNCSFSRTGTKFCHVDGCTPININRNYTAHENCCYGKLARLYHKKRTQYKSPYRTKEENIADFLNLCENIFEDRLKNAEYTVQYIDKYGNLVKAKHRSEWGSEIISWQDYIKNDNNFCKTN